MAAFGAASAMSVSRDKLIDLSTSLGLLSEPSKRAVLEALPLSATYLRK